jgi:NADH-quinone oxidoreductase subunit E
MTAWTAEMDARAAGIVARYPDPRSAVMPLLYMAMLADGGLTDDGMRKVAERAGVSPAQVRAVASFYTMYKEGEVGRYVISVCQSISCHLLDSSAVAAAAVEATGVPIGETGPDGSFTVETVECIGACGGAPAIQVNYEMVEGLDPDRMRSLCEWLGSEQPEAVNGDELQERFGGRRSFDWGPSDPTTAVGPVPAFGPYGSAGEGP